MFDTYTYGVCLVEGQRRRYKRSFAYGIVTLKLSENTLPVHRDLLANHYSFFRDLPGEFVVVELDPTVITPRALDYLLCFHYPDAHVPERPSFALCTEAVVAYDFFGGGLESRESEATSTFVLGGRNNTIGPAVNDVMQSILDDQASSPRIWNLEPSPLCHDTIVGAMQRNSEIFGKTLERYELLTKASPEKKRIMVNRLELQSRWPKMPLDDMTKKDLIREFGKQFKGSKDELAELVSARRAQEARDLLLKTCDVTESARRALFDEMMSVHTAYVPTDDDEFQYYMLPEGVIVKTYMVHGNRYSAVLKAPVIGGPQDLTRYFFHDFGNFPLLVYIPGREFRGELPCIQGSQEQLFALHDRFVELYSID